MVNKRISVGSLLTPSSPPPILTDASETLVKKTYTPSIMCTLLSLTVTYCNNSTVLCKQSQQLYWKMLFHDCSWYIQYLAYVPDLGTISYIGTKLIDMIIKYKLKTNTHIPTSTQS